MKNASKGGLIFVGLDVHKRTVAVAVALEGETEIRHEGTTGGKAEEVLAALLKLCEPERLRVVYEAGFSGFVLARTLLKAGISCCVVPPSTIPLASGRKVKTDRLDAMHLANLHRAGILKSVRIPNDKTEAMRDLCRARLDFNRALRTARQRLLKFLDRHGIYYQGKTWTKTHKQWIRSLTFAHLPQRVVLEQYLKRVEEAEAALALMDREIADHYAQWELKPVAQALMTMRSINILGAVHLLSEIDDFRRFETPAKLAAYVGLVPGENSSGDRRRQGPLTKRGNRQLRHLLIQAAHNQRFEILEGPAIAIRRLAAPPTIVDIARKAQYRLARKRSAMLARKLDPRKVVCAMAREMCGVLWALAHEQYRLTPEI